MAEKIFNDPVHGHIRIHALCVKIIDTPQFQRLRFLKQLGNAYYIYPGSSHNRFEHSLGVCYLAGEFARSLQQRQPELNIESKDILCVEIAGLCHDLGHGPYSHFFDQKFLPTVRPDYKDGDGQKWTHENASVKMLDFLIKANNLWPEFTKYELKDTDLLFIKEQIQGTETKEGRPTEKCFLYEIVANKVNGIDVDKWDYFARDSLMLGMKTSFDHSRLMKFARVLEVEDRNGKIRRRICFRDKEVWDLYEMFHTRYMLHLRAYQHVAVRGIDDMLGEALILANDHLKFEGRNGSQLKMSEAIDDMEAYMKMNDYSVVFLIQHSKETELENSQDLIRKIQKRDLYAFIGQTQLKGDKWQSEFNGSETDVEEQIQNEILQHIPESTLERMLQHIPESTLKRIQESILKRKQELTLQRRMANVIFVERVTLKKDQNPIDEVHFYSKHEPNKSIHLSRDQVSQLLPERVQEMQIRIYSKSKDQETVESLKEAMCKWCKEKKYPEPIRM